jgi:hypothetical protein
MNKYAMLEDEATIFRKCKLVQLRKVRRIEVLEAWAELLTR